jgi:hypothetical protein
MPNSIQKVALRPLNPVYNYGIFCIIFIFNHLKGGSMTTHNAREVKDDK